jgi:hypothetical protein
LRVKTIISCALLSIVFLVFSNKSGFGQEYYHRYRDDFELKWAYFEGKIKEDSALTAAISVTIGYDLLYTDKYVAIDLGAYFSPKDSWVKVRSEKGLRHESYHFKLAEISRRMMLKELYEIEIELNYLESLMEDRLRNFGLFHDGQQDKYDLETSHGAYKEKQVEYENYIDEWLFDLNPYRFKYLVIYIDEQSKVQSKELTDILPGI